MILKYNQLEDITEGLKKEIQQIEKLIYLDEKDKIIIRKSLDNIKKILNIK